jgi:FkbM family methyltransferase
MVSSFARKLRPAKIRNAVRRRWFERQVPRQPFSDLTGGLIDLGSSYGGWLVPAGLPADDWIAYSVGIGADISFDLELIHRWNATVRAFDAVAAFVDDANVETADEPRFGARQAAIATVDGPLRMQVSDVEHSRSVSSAELYESANYVELPGRTLPSLMAEVGDERIDLLKLDIEGAEYAVLPRLDLRSLGVKVFATQLHHTGTVGQARQLIDGLRTAGYLPVGVRPEVKMTFVRDDLI